MYLLAVMLAALPHSADAELRNEPIGSFAVAGEVRSVTVSPDGSYVAAAGKSRRLVIWRPGTGATVSTEFDSNVTVVAASPDGRFLLLGTEKGSLVALGPDGQARWTVATGSRAIRAVAVSPDGGLIATGAATGAVELRKAFDGSLFRVVGRHDRAVVDVGFASGGRRLLSADDLGVRAWPVYASGSVPEPSPLRSELMGAFHIFGLSASDDHTAVVGQYRYLGKGSLSMAGGPSTIGFNEDDHMMVYHGGARAPEHTVRTQVGWNDLSDVCLTSDSRFLAVSTERRPDDKKAGMAVVWEIEKEEPRLFVNLAAAGRAVSVSSDGRVLAAGDAQGNVVVHRVRGMETDVADSVVTPLPSTPRIGRECAPPRIELEERTAPDAAARSRSVLVAGRVSDPCGNGVDGVWTNGERVSAIEPAGPGAARFSSYVGVSGADQQVVVRAISRSGAEANSTFPVHAESTPAGQAESLGRRRARALVVGISRYSEPSLNLSFADRDAQAFAGFLTSGRSVTGLAASDVNVLLNERATLENVAWGFEQFLAQGDKNDVILLFYAGHGAPAAPAGGGAAQLYLLPHDARAANLAATGYPMSRLREVLSRSSAQHLIVFADACHSGGVGAGELGGSPQPAGTADKTGSAASINRGFLSRFQHSAPSRVVFASAERNQVALEPVELQGGVFSHFLMRGLEGGADENEDRVVTLGELIEYVRSSVRHFTKGRQVPAISATSFDRELPLAKVDP